MFSGFKETFKGLFGERQTDLFDNKDKELDHDAKQIIIPGLQASKAWIDKEPVSAKSDPINIKSQTNLADKVSYEARAGYAEAKSDESGKSWDN